MAGGPNPYKTSNKEVRADLASIVFDLRVQGLSFYAIDALTQSPSGPTGGKRIPASTARDLAREEHARRLDPKVDEYRALQLARHEAALERLRNMEESVRTVMARKHITVNNGKVIYIGDEPVEDDTFVLQAVDRLNRIEEQRRKTGDSIASLLGLNMPIKVDQTVTETTQQDIELQEMIRDAKAKVQLEEQQIIDGGSE
ncbi:hypothetical protein [Streptomyces sp. NBC_01373]|uniref:hypothetical protein n=1 Tax=Streptomyces sp. NBC_01373 TaxID=2903843 RepID=UPI00224E7E11|nr:hypothetical protein [Streptomyces sp. NBC_01373]MCX4707086.1 hypothetical protein [Streptomyces sp. NBC_01373]